MCRRAVPTAASDIRLDNRPSSRSRAATHLLFVLALGGPALSSTTPAYAVCAIAQYGEPKYPAKFQHFDYVNPAAPRDGTLVLANPNRLTSFDKFNPFTLRGNPAPGLGLLFESLTTGSADEVASAYCLLADDIDVAKDGLSTTFHINPKARFSNGDPVTAADVKFSLDTLKSPQALPQFAVYFAQIARAVVLDRLTIRFDFKVATREMPLLVGGIPVFSRKWGMRADGTRIPFDQLAFEKPIASGEYLIDRYDNGRTIRYLRNPDYWGKSLPVRVGTHNFARIDYKLYADTVSQLEGFKAGEYDVLVEHTAQSWVRRDVGKRFDSGELIKREFMHHNGAGMQGFFINLRRPLFQDVRVRKALDLAFDFEWLNRQLFYNQYKRTDSYFVNTDLQATGTPGAGELAILDPLRGQLDPAVFGPMPRQPDTDPPGSLRANLLEARALLAQAGWTYRDGALRNASGQPFVFELLGDSGGDVSMEPVAAAYARNLQKLGITMRFRTADFALIQRRIDAFDFDMTTVRLPDVQVPGTEQLSRFGSRYADEPGSDNIAGVKSPAIDRILRLVLGAQTREQLLDATHALDRVLMHGYYVIPHWYSAVHRIAYRNTLAYPARVPLYFAADEWVLSVWWRQSPPPSP
ncbi:extracellular solute-binding protein [Paraburkholderia sp. MMS20-SJTR3]|uniref:Extracellular solute-binding protein n=1 Tax=Paraburkholderia sejongensis TaxID=2886946 RepID=A0ABS8JR23_9BURK|nr:extracellular solute-binding protein [Paraburkholderia sp. MMS20-SJTR3]MCC8392205.1 extracellular solute-binding protein [Paraburkholderia sp. MMS20-SJTR3]